ncbi:hypothetical protein [Pseudomonas sp. NPDC090208]|uniref:hypothetical protein n=1 Tax=Pseudomonas sp. NPDC090208 TaxID=3364478 RepID=UPI0037FCF2C0
MPQIQRSDPAVIASLDVPSEASEHAVLEDVFDLDDLPQGVVNLLQQLMPQQPRLSVFAASLPMAEKAAEMEADPEPGQSTGGARVAVTQSSPGAIPSAASFGSEALVTDEQVTEMIRNLPASKADLPDPGAGLNVAQRAVPLEARFLARGPASAEKTSVFDQVSARLAVPSAPLEAAGKSGPYLNLPFSREGLAGVVIVNRQAGEPLMPLQLSASRPEISAHLARHLESTPQEHWSMSEGPASDSHDERGGRRHPHDHDEDPAENPLARRRSEGRQP